jgi:hypothetical protein
MPMVRAPGLAALGDHAIAVDLRAAGLLQSGDSGLRATS